MPPSHDRTVRALFDAFARRDLATMAEVLHPDIEFHGPTAAVAADDEPYRGMAGIERYLRDVEAVWEELRIEPRELRVEGDTVVVTGRVYAWGSGRVVDAPAGWVWRLREGRIAWGRAFDSRHAAFEAAGLPDPAEPGRP